MEAILERFPFAYYHIALRYFVAAGLTFLVFYVIFRKRMPLRKIQERFPKAKDYLRDAGYSLITVAIFAVISIWSFKVLKPYHLLFDSFESMPAWYWPLTVIPMFFIHDFYFYWAHRLMHHPKLFKQVHKVHHLSTNPSPWTAYAFHPFEAVIEALIITILCFTVPTHAAIIVLFMIFQIFYNVYGHLGYELYPRGFNKTWIGKYVNTSVAHNQHHHKFQGNYGLYTLIWDRVFGTLRTDYDDAYDQAASRRVPAKETVLNL
jgi:sterol desaturase/sphingolipid hydroxylase (fatty acid hydroxylase superfamily)